MIINYLLDKQKEENIFLSLWMVLGFEKMLSDKDLFFWNEKNYNTSQNFISPKWLLEERSRLFDFIQNNNGNLNIFAPTSFGKNILNYSTCFKFKSTMFDCLSPTLSLCNEYFMNMKHRQKKYTKNWAFDKLKLRRAENHIHHPHSLCRYLYFDSRKKHFSFWS